MITGLELLSVWELLCARLLKKLPACVSAEHASVGGAWRWELELALLGYVILKVYRYSKGMLLQNIRHLQYSRNVPNHVAQLKA